MKMLSAQLYIWFKDCTMIIFQRNRGLNLFKCNAINRKTNGSHSCSGSLSIEDTATRLCAFASYNEDT